MVLNLITLASETHAAEEGGINPWFVGIGSFGVLLVLLLALLAFAGGREHS